MHVWNKELIQLQGHVKVPGGECHSVHLELLFPFSCWGPIRAFALAFCSEWLPTLRWPGPCADFPAKSRYNIIGASCGDIPMMWVSGWWHLHHNYIRVGGYKRITHRGRGSQFWDFRCRAYRAKLIPSRVLQCVPTLGQPGILYLITTKRCLVYCLILISIFLWSGPCFYWIWLLEWPSSQWVQLKRLVYLATRTAVLYQSWQRLEEERSGSPCLSTPSHSKIVTDLWHPWVGSTKVSKWQLWCYRVPGNKDCCPLSELAESRGREIREYLVTHPLL